MLSKFVILKSRVFAHFFSSFVHTNYHYCVISVMSCAFLELCMISPKQSECET